MATELRNKTAIVTGGSKGIGYGIAEALIREGMNVVISARGEDDLRQAEQSLSGAGEGKVLAIRSDMRSYEDVKQMISRTIEEFGRLDLLVNNAGVGAFGAVDEMSVDKWEQVIETNLNGVFYACREAIPHMRKQGDGWIINIASLAGKNPFAGGAAYNASKFGLVGFSEALMLDVRQAGIRVNYIMPGSVNTDFAGPSGRHSDRETDWMIQPEDIADLVVGLLRMPSRTLPSRIEVRPSRPPKK